MPKLNEVFKTMAEQSGLDLSNATIKTIMENPAFASVDVDDEVSTKLTANRLTMDAAKNNPDLHKHFTALTLNAVDKKIKDAAASFGLSEDEIKELDSEKSSYERVSLLAKKVKEIEAKKASATIPDKAIFTKQIDELNAQILNEKKSFSTEKESLLASFENERLNWRMDSIYSEFVPQMNQTIKPSINLTIAKQTVSEVMQSKGYKTVNKDGNLTLVNEAGGDVYEDNKKLSLKDFITKTLANEKLLTVSQTTSSTQTKKQERVKTPQSSNNSGDKNTSSFLSKLAELEEN